MVRKSKEDAEKTRQQILDAARLVFAEQGVSKTTLAQIAKAAGVTRGAIYWHFQNKIDLFFAMKEQVPLPLLDQNTIELSQQPTQNPLQQIEEFFLSLLQQIKTDNALRDTFEIMHFKCEYVDEFAAVHQRMMQSYCAIVEQLQSAYQQAAQQQLLKAGLKPELCAWESFLFFSGLIRLWLAADSQQFLQSQAEALIKHHMQSRS